MIKQAQIQWQNGSPVSTQFDDVYFSKASGIDETRYVFLEHNQLPQRWVDHPAAQFTIAETGFGTGLNFLCAWESWLKHSQAGQTLNFVSVEKFPLDKTSLQLALDQWPKLKTLSDALVSVYPSLVAGWHCIPLPIINESSGQVILHLYLGDIHEWLDEYQGKVDAWFLDGFAPAKNPEMWSPHLFESMGKLSTSNTTVATFTAAGLVRRGLQGVGFATQKVKGFGRKREMLCAEYQQIQGPCQPQWLSGNPWFLPPNFNSKQRHAVIIGAGIAGCSTAYALAKRGWKVTLMDKHQTFANGASGNAQGVLYAKLASKMNPQSEFYLSGYLFSLHQLKQNLGDNHNWQNCGVLQLAFNEKEHARQQMFIQKSDLSAVVSWVNAAEATQLAGIPIWQGGLYFHDGAWVYPSAWCEALIQHPNITFLNETRLEQLSQDSTQQWHLELTSKNGATSTIHSEAVIMCNAHEAKAFKEFHFLPTQPIAGQVSQVDSSALALKTVLCGDSYVTPMHNGKLNFGASYRLKSDDTQVTREDNQFNLDKLADNFPSVFGQLSLSENIHGRASVRCSTPDYVPVVGAVCDTELFKQRFANLKKNKNWRFNEAAPFLTGLYVNLGHGSRGLSSAPLCAELVAAQLNNEPWPMCKRHADMLSPNRFLVNQVIKGE
ncbi:MAG: bifunctional tRNA (5-methylaminomethyl-2-thiouridine)(34)-methyltransferase MnmD/FAD-dependent 5-carboxymethylaminomethyl-2-thiouridine(34) oxidoreductase MnmC [Gammaproteobacteria bacterium]|nr:bifunctional tRNA (5-methylaminomethyl-2-thiouridine)(34)-methyltransferase MnmD/FAD-dependent 5-carboxymethylaminomethyl-2-thiouridine(34) oxidoreductase MnmC [Gammaproteobacteria bacterium]